MIIFNFILLAVSVLWQQYFKKKGSWYLGNGIITPYAALYKNKNNKKTPHQNNKKNPNCFSHTDRHNLLIHLQTIY